MGGLSVFHWIAVLFVLLMLLAMSVLPIVAIWKILKRMGFSPALSLLYLVPLAPLIGLYVIAFSKWPAVPDSPADTF